MLPTTMSNPGSTVLSDAEDIIIVPLSSVTMIYTTLLLCFLVWEYDPETREEREICCFRFSDLPSHIDPRPRIPILFEIIGQIAFEDCFLTADGYEDPVSSGQEDEHLATCWIETRDEYVSRIYWQGIAPAVQEIASHIPGSVDASRLLGEVDGEVILQVCYQPPAGQVRAVAVHIYLDHSNLHSSLEHCVDSASLRHRRSALCAVYYFRGPIPATNAYHICAPMLPSPRQP